MPDLTGAACSAPNDKFVFSPKGLWSDSFSPNTPIYPRRCVEVQHGTVVESQVFAKPLPNGRMAVFAFNAGVRNSTGQLVPGANISLSLSLSEDLHLPAAATYRVRDVWAGRDLPSAAGTLRTAPIGEHDSVLLTLSPAGGQR